MAQIRKEAWPVTAILLATLIFFTPRFYGYTYSTVAHFMSLTYPWMGAATPRIAQPSLIQQDNAETFYPLAAFSTQAWQQGEIPFWYPYNFGGFPILELGMTSLLYPPRILLSYFFDPIRQQDLMMFLHLLLAGLGMYALLRTWGANAPGSVAGGLLWELSGNNTLSLPLGHTGIVAVWFPLMLLAAARAVRLRSFKWASATGATIGVALYSGATHAVYLSGLWLALWYGVETCQAVWAAWRKKQKRLVLTHLSLPLVSLVVALLVGLAYWLPLLGLLPELSRQPLSFELQAALWHSWREIVGAPQLVSYSFTGLVGLSLAACGLVLKRSRHVTLAFALLLLTLMTLRGVPWWLRALRQLPFFATITLYEFFYVLAFPVAVLAGFGLSMLVERLQRAERTIPTYVLGLILALGAFELSVACRAYQQAYSIGLSQLFAWLSDKATWRYLFVLIFIVCLALALNRPKWELTRNWPTLAGYAATLLIVLVLSFHAWLILPQQFAYREWFFPETPFIAELKTRQGESRFLPVYQHTAPEPEFVYFGKTPFILAGKTPALFGLRSGSGYESLLPRRTQLLWRIVQRGGRAAALEKLSSSYKPVFFHDSLPINLLEKLSIGLLVTPPQVEPVDAVSGQNLVAHGTLRLHYRGPDGWIYEHPAALKRVFLVPQVWPVRNEEQALQSFTSPEFNARQAAIIEESLSPSETGLLQTSDPAPFSAEAARIVRESLNEVEIVTHAARPGVLVLNDAWAANWRVTVDGAAQTVHRVNYNARGVILSGGQHRVVFRYRPLLLLVSIWISGLSLLLTCGWFLVAPISNLVSGLIRQKENEAKG